MEEREIKDQAIVLKSEETGEADRFITLLTSNYGKIKAKIRGVKKAKAKLAYASFPFNFGEYILIKTGRSYTVINCSYIDNFQALTADLNRYWAGAGILEIANALSREASDSYSLAIMVLKFLKELCYNEEINIFAVLSKFLIEALEFSGFKLGVENSDGKYFDFELGKITNIGVGELIELEKEDALNLKYLIESEIEGCDMTISVSKTLLKLLILFYENKVDEEIKVLKRFI